MESTKQWNEKTTSLLCIPSRILLTAFAYGASRKQLRGIGIATFIFAVSNIVSTIVRLARKKPLNDKDGKRYWWANIVTLHGVLYAVTAWLALTGSNKAFVPLAFDVALSAFARLHALTPTDTT